MEDKVAEFVKSAKDARARQLLLLCYCMEEDASAMLARVKEVEAWLE